jgi:GT2 family glycosyltransferase
MLKLSIVILCWNDLRVIRDCLESIYTRTHLTPFEIIISDNGSTDGSIEFIREKFPQVRVIENGANLRFSKGNNVGIRASEGEYVLILNPDTIIHEGSLDRWVAFADRHPEAGAFGCRVLNPDGSYQGSAQPFPTIAGSLIAALYLRWLAYISSSFTSDTYTRWRGDTERKIDWQAGCCVMFRADLLKRLGGFDEQFFYYYEDVDLCHRVWKAGFPVIYTPDVTINHLGGQSTQRAPHAFEVDKYRNRYRYFYKYYGKRGARQCRTTTLVWLFVRYLGYRLLQLVGSSQKQRLDLYRTAIKWNMQVDPVLLVEQRLDPDRSLSAGLRYS